MEIGINIRDELIYFYWKMNIKIKGHYKFSKIFLFFEKPKGKASKITLASKSYKKLTFFGPIFLKKFFEFFRSLKP
jgi:hypothetical protein